MARVRAREFQRVAGTVSAVTRSTTSARPRLTISVADGTGDVRAVFMGRRDVPGITTGRAVALRARFTVQDGELVALNPEYQLLTALPEN